MAGSLDLQWLFSKSNDINAYKLCVFNYPSPQFDKPFQHIPLTWKRKSWSCQRQVCAQMGCWPEGWGSLTRPLYFLNLYVHNWQTCDRKRGKYQKVYLVFSHFLLQKLHILQSFSGIRGWWYWSLSGSDADGDSLNVFSELVCTTCTFCTPRSAWAASRICQ